jgi:L-ornithine Nalpha-acyltransferase
LLNAPKVNPSRIDALDAEFSKMGMNGLILRFAQDEADLHAAQNVRYKVFYEEMGAKPIKDMAKLERDYDDFDNQCQHLLVVDTNDDPKGKIVGTYRMFFQKKSIGYKPFYTEGEFDISKIKEQGHRILEVGRSCILEEYRKRFVIQLLWQGIGAYIHHHDVDFLIGCASLDGIDMQEHAMTLSYLHHFHLVRPELRTTALPHLYKDINMIPKDQIDEKKSLMALPPLIKGYLRLGGKIGDGAIIDEQFNTVDVCIIVERELISGKHIDYYLRDRSSNNATSKGE